MAPVMQGQWLPFGSTQGFGNLVGMGARLKGTLLGALCGRAHRCVHISPHCLPILQKRGLGAVRGRLPGD